MTAVEWFYQRMFAKDITSVFEQAKDIEQQQKDEFAIGFAEWVECSKTYYTPMKELLQIYKKEKGL